MTPSCITLGLSGGVDSSVAALLLQTQGHAIQGVFMQNWVPEENDPYCEADQDLKDARGVCEKLHIAFETVSFAQTYWDTVFEHFLQEYTAGRTPNPDIGCNKEIKFKAFLDYALANGSQYIATGHYARIQKKDGLYQLLKAQDLNKDQSYFLYTLQQEQLAHSLFPLGEYTKPEVRKIAEAAGFTNHAKKDSTGICFIGERRFKDFLGEYLLARPGNIETTEGQVIGRHEGLMFYTIGQRQGLGIGGQKEGDGEPWYVADKDIPRQALIVAQSRNHPRLFKKTLILEQAHWVAGFAPAMPLSCSAKIRYRQTDAACSVEVVGKDQYRVHFEEPQFAVAPGQSVVLYDQESCLGGGIIDYVANASVE